MKLEDFFSETQALLMGRTDARSYQRKLGTSSSGTSRLEYYQTLIRRNMMKVLRDMYPSVRNRYLQFRPGQWGTFVERFTRQHPPPSHWDPNQFSAPLPEFLAAERERDPKLPSDLEQLADFHWTEFCVFSASETWPQDLGPDGMEHRLYVRQYDGKIPQYARQLIRDPEAVPGSSTPTPTLIYRDLKTHRTAVFYPTILGLLVLSKRSGKTLPKIPGVTSQNLEIAEKDLIQRGILTAGSAKT